MEITYHIDGITCQKCVRLITEALTEIEGVTQVIVVKEQNAATVRLKEHFGSRVFGPPKTGSRAECLVSYRGLCTLDLEKHLRSLNPYEFKWSGPWATY